MIGYLRKNFPATVTSDTVKRFSLAPNNESYVINALQFLGILDEDGKRTDKAHEIFVLSDEEFAPAFAELVKDGYADLFELRGDEAWELPKGQLVSYFRAADKTSEIIGSRQAAVFQVFRSLAGRGSDDDAPAPRAKSTPRSATKKPSKPKEATKPKANSSPKVEIAGKKDMALTVRIEVNLPANGSKETYDNIFKSIRQNLIDG